MGKFAFVVFSLAMTSCGSAQVEVKEVDKVNDAIKLGIQFLLSQQLPDGSWSLNNFRTKWPDQEKERAQLMSDAAATGLALMAIHGGRDVLGEDWDQKPVDRGVAWLIENQSDKGDFYVEVDELSSKSVRFYSHAISTIALAEIYSSSPDPKLKAALGKALEFIIAAQDKIRGGWRYRFGINADTSVTCWIVEALHQLQQAGFDVPMESLELVERYLARAQDRQNSHLYIYNPDGRRNDPRQADGLKSTPSMTAAGLLIRTRTGWKPTDERCVAGADYLLKNLPRDGTEAEVQQRKNARDSYYWHVASRFLKQVGGERWKNWSDTLYPYLLERQEKEGAVAGSWNPGGRIPDRWGRFGGRIYLTSLNIVMLEMYDESHPAVE